jgi:hypothetical protein
MQKPEQVSRPDGVLAAQQENALRCCCGSLLARVVAAGVEIKCRRCKRRVVVPLNAKGTVRLGM